MSNLNKEWAHSTLRQMMLIRAFEETADKLSLRGKISRGIHNSSGQESAAVTVAGAYLRGVCAQVQRVRRADAPGWVHHRAADGAAYS